MLATEILDNADDIADLTNSDFMSGKQKNRILNENYRAIYQKIVNHGDRYLLQVLHPNADGKYILPNDFYQLHSITAGHGSIQIPRKVIGMSESSSGYVIEKNEIIIKGYTNIEVLYYPKPERIYTGSGEVLRQAYGDEPEIIDDTITNIEMRNNLFFDVLAYMCALQYKQKQNADTTAIQQQLAEKIEVFFDTLTEDDYERLRVRNVY